MESPEEVGPMTSDPQHQDVLLPSTSPVTRALGSSSASTTEIPTDNNYLFADELPVVRSSPAFQDASTNAGRIAADQRSFDSTNKLRFDRIRPPDSNGSFPMGLGRPVRYSV